MTLTRRKFLLTSALVSSLIFAPAEAILFSGATIGFPGQPSNPVGFAATPAVMPTFTSPTTWPGGAWPGAYPGSLNATTPTLTSGASPTNPNIYSFYDFVGQTDVSGLSNITFVGCRFQNSGSNNFAVVVGNGASNISFFYCSGVPKLSIVSTPPSGGGYSNWPSGGNGVVPAAEDNDPTYSIASNKGLITVWQLYGGTPGAPPSGLVQLDHCDSWGSGAAVAMSGGGSAGVHCTDCWFHDGCQGNPDGYHTNVFCDTNYGDLSNVTARHCTFATIGNSNNVSFQNNPVGGGLGQVNYNSIIIDNCWIAGTHSNLIVMGAWSGGINPSQTQVQNCQFTNNIISTGLQWAFGWLYGDESGIFVSNTNTNGNRWRNNVLKIWPNGPPSASSNQQPWTNTNANNYCLPDSSYSTTDWT